MLKSLSLCNKVLSLWLNALLDGSVCRTACEYFCHFVVVVVISEFNSGGTLKYLLI